MALPDSTKGYSRLRRLEAIWVPKRLIGRPEPDLMRLQLLTWKVDRPPGKKCRLNVSTRPLGRGQTAEFPTTLGQRSRELTGAGRPVRCLPQRPCLEADIRGATRPLAEDRPAALANETAPIPGLRRHLVDGAPIQPLTAHQRVRPNLQVQKSWRPEPMTPAAGLRDQRRVR